MLNIVNWLNGWTLDGKLSILIFLPFAGLLFLASIRLVKYAEVIILKTRFGGGFIGGALIAAVTSLPEMITEIAQSSAGLPGAGTADDVGSNAFSGFLIALSLIILWKTKFFHKLDKFSRISILISSILAFLLFILMFINKDASIGGYIGIIPMSLFIIYLIMLIVQYKFDNSSETSEIHKYVKSISVKKAFTYFSIYALVITTLALVVNLSASSMIKGIGLPQDGVGGILLAITTSLPEVVAYFAFLRKKQPTAAVAALIGSHFFNIGIAFFGDLAYTDGPTFKNNEVGANWPVALFTGIMMLIIFIQIAFSKKIKSNLFHLGMPLLAATTYILGWTLTLAL